MTKAPRKKPERPLDLLEEAINAIQTSDEFADWLEARAKFYEYSPYNSMIIHHQLPAATRVLGFRAWQKKFNRNVNKGESAIWILAPTPFKAVATNDDGEDEEVSRMRFRAVPVFDVSQTSGDPLPAPPTPAPVTGASHGTYIPQIEDLAKQLGYSVTYAAIEGSGLGFCRPHDQAIHVEESLSPNGRLRILVHELVHAHGVDYQKFTRPEAETIAESSAFLVCRAIGLDVATATAPYVAGWSTPADRRNTVDYIEHYSSLILNALGWATEVHPLPTRQEAAIAA